MTAPTPHIPQQHPEVAIVPGASLPIPERNQPLPHPETWQAHAMRLDGQLAQLRTAHAENQSHIDGPERDEYIADLTRTINPATNKLMTRDEAIDLYDNEKFSGRNPKKDARNRFNATRSNVIGFARNLMQKHDPEQVIALFDRRGESSQVHEDEDQVSARKLAGARAASVREVVGHHTNIRHLEHEHAGVDLKRPENEAAAKEVRDSGIYQGRALQDNAKAAVKNIAAYQRAGETEGRSDAIWDIGIELYNEREKALESCKKGLRDAAHILRDKAALTQELGDTERDDIEKLLDGTAVELDNLSPFDPARAELRAIYITLGHRLKQREIATNVFRGDPIDVELTPDGGIIVNRETSKETVLYDNGDEGIVTRDPATNNIVDIQRIKGDGSPSEVTPDTKIDQIDPTRPERYDFPHQELKEWDIQRNPETTARAHAELKCYNQSLEKMDATAETAYFDTLNRKTQIENFIISVPARINDEKIRISQIDTYLNNNPKLKAKERKKAQADRDSALQRLNQLPAQEAQARADWTVNEQHVKSSAANLDKVRRDVGKKIGQSRYWQGLLENRMTPESPVSFATQKKKVLGLITIPQVVQVNPNQMDPTVDLLRDGSVIWKNLVSHDPKTSTLAPRTVGVWRWFSDGKRRRIA